MGSCYSSKDRDLTVIYWTDSAPVLVQDGEYTELTLEGDNEIGPFCSMPSLNLSGDELLTVGELESSGDDYFAAFDLDGNELARSSQPVGSFNAVMMKRPNGYLLDTGYMWELYAPDGTLVSTTENNIVSAEFNAEKLLKFREKFRFLNDRDSFEVF